MVTEGRRTPAAPACYHFMSSLFFSPGTLPKSNNDSIYQRFAGGTLYRQRGTQNNYSRPFCSAKFIWAADLSLTVRVPDTSIEIWLFAYSALHQELFYRLDKDYNTKKDGYMLLSR